LSSKKSKILGIKRFLAHKKSQKTYVGADFFYGFWHNAAMKNFSEILPTLAPIDNITALVLVDALGNFVAQIDNKPGSAGSVRVYHHLFQQFGVINVASAKAGLELYAEHTEDAKLNLGEHPNIDRLLDVIETGTELGVKVLMN
jgi:hypothetical protein